MAIFQRRHKWMVMWWALVTVFIICIDSSSGCHPLSRELHICLNIYLERDFNLIETVVEVQQKQAGRRRVIVEGPELDTICMTISNLVDCYEPLIRECDTLWQLDRFENLRVVLRATHHHLCGNGTNNVKDLLLNSACLARAKTHISDCTGFNWWFTWREVLRMQVSPSDRCLGLKAYRNCLKRSIPEELCGKEAPRVYLALFDVWLRSWCALHSTPEEERKYLYSALNADWSSALNHSDNKP